MMSLMSVASRHVGRFCRPTTACAVRGAHESGVVSHHCKQLRAATLSCFDSTSRGFATDGDKKKKKKRSSPASAKEGRVVAMQESKLSKSGASSRLCSGCGVQVTRGDNVGMIGGSHAVEENVSNKQEKKMRYVDVSDTSTTFLCERCKALKSDNVWKAYDALYDVSPEVFSKQLEYIVGRRRFGLCILVVDSTDPEHSAIKRLRKCIGSVPCILVLTKRDLVPRMSRGDVKALSRGVSKIVGTKFVDHFAVSSVTGQGIFAVAESLLSQLRGRDVFVVGSANVGKSTLVQKLAGTIAEAVYMKGRKGMKRRQLASNLPVTGSHLPGTTLQAVRIPCFSKPGHALWDTPGIINSKAIQYNLFPSHLMEPLARPGAIPVPSAENRRQGQLRVGDTLLIEADWMEEQDDEDACVLGRIDLAHVADKSTVYSRAFLHPSLRLRVVPTKDAPDHATIPSSFVKQINKLVRNSKLKDEYSLPLKPFITKDLPEGKVSPRENERNMHTGSFYMDIVFASLGWISFAHRDEFSVIPHCVEGSVFSKRRALYPMNLVEPEEADDYDMDDLTHMHEPDEQEMRRRLQHAAREGRHNKKDYISGSEFEGAFGGGFDEDEWY